MQSAGDNDGIYLIKTPTDVNSAMARMKGESNIEVAEPNWIYTHTQISNDTYYLSNELWGMYSDIPPAGTQGTNISPYGSQADKAWSAENIGSKNIAVGIIDEGIQVEHTDLDANIWRNPKEISNKKDDDGNGYVDDIYGWDFANNDNSVYDGGPKGTADQHGTHVSGTIGAERNGAGVVGVNWNVTLISAKFLGRNGGTTSNAIKAIDYITDLKKRHTLNLVATNNSWGGGGDSKLLLEAITRGANAEILFIAAAGNSSSNNDGAASYPSNYNTEGVEVLTGKCTYDAVIAVAAIESDGKLASYSNYGSTKVDLGAPGTWIISSIPPNTYKGYSGTSMATPHVTGAAALYASVKLAAGATWKAIDIKNAILSSAVPTASLEGKCSTNGRLDVFGALSK
jgi:subtilisin family serine protease